MNTAPTATRDRQQSLAYLAIIVAVFLWGGSFAAMRSAIGTVGSFSLMTLRTLVAASLLLPFLPFFIRQLKISRKPGDFKLLLFTVLMQPCLYFLAESNALRFTSASQAGMISATVPILTAIGAWLVLREPVGKRMIFGIILAVLGIVVITISGNDSSGASRPLLGNGLEFLAMIFAAGNLIAVRGLSRRYNTWLLTAMQTFAGAIFFLPGIVPLLKSGIGLSDIPWIPVLYLGIGSSLGAFGLYNWGMGQIPAARASSFINLVPVVAAIGAWLILGERLSSFQMLGGAIVLVGVVVSQERR